MIKIFPSILLPPPSSSILFFEESFVPISVYITHVSWKDFSCERNKKREGRKRKTGRRREENVEKYRTVSLACYLSRLPSPMDNGIVESRDFLAMPRVIFQKLRFPFPRGLETEKGNSLSSSIIIVKKNVRKRPITRWTRCRKKDIYSIEYLN